MKQKGPLSQILFYWYTRDIKDFYPSCNKKKYLEAVQILLDTREKTNPKYRMCSRSSRNNHVRSSDTTEFDTRFFTQIDGATIGFPDSGSITDIFSAVHTGKKIQENCPIEPETYCQYRDDTLDVCQKSSREDQELATVWMNENIYKDKIKFTAEYNDKKMVFLDTEITVQEAVINNKRGLYLIPQMYSKDTDTHQYLNPSSCHSPHITNNLPTSVIE